MDEKQIKHFIKYAYDEKNQYPIHDNNVISITVKSNTCTDKITLYYLKSNKDIFSYEVEGCATCRASSALIIESLNENTIEFILKNGISIINNKFGENIFLRKESCCKLVLHALEQLNNYLNNVDEKCY